MVKLPKRVPRRRRAAFWGVCCLGGVVVLFAAAAVIPCRVPAKATAQKHACINNLRMLDRAKERWALEKKVEKGALVMMGDLMAGEHSLVREVPKCSRGGEYAVGAIGEVPKCTLEEKGHRL